MENDLFIKKNCYCQATEKQKKKTEMPGKRNKKPFAYTN